MKFPSPSESSEPGNVVSHPNGYDNLAPVYDFLAMLIFGNAIRLSHHAFLEEIKPAKNILILGGGTGEFLSRLRSLNPACSITYIDASAAMIREAQKRIPDQNITFIHGTENSILHDSRYDAIITYFYLDLFDDATLPSIVKHLSAHLTNDGVWLVSDFRDEGKWWQHALLKSMYLFFGFTTGLKTRQLAYWKNELERVGFRLKREKSFYHGFIKSALFVRKALAG